MSESAIRSFLLRSAARMHGRLWWTRAMTFGVRILVLDGDRILLIRHTYLPGWFLPGGGVDRGESAEAAAIRELREEGGVLCRERPVLHGLFRNGRRDQVACYVLRAFAVVERRPNWEITESGFFPRDALPEGTSRSTRARIEEVLDGLAPPDHW